MKHNIEIIVKPEWISYNDIHDLLYLAHESNRQNGFNVKTAEMKGEELAEHIGVDGECYVALIDKKLVGVTAVKKVLRNNKYSKGVIAAQILSAVHPDYQGQGISSAFHEKVIEFAIKHGIRIVEGRVASENVNIQNALLKWGFHYVDFLTFPNIDHYTIVMLKWLDDAKISNIRLKIYYNLKKIYITTRYKPGKVKRFMI